MNEEVKQYIKTIQGFSEEEALEFRDTVVMPYLTKDCYSFYEKTNLFTSYKKMETKSIFIELFHKIKNFSAEELDYFNQTHVLKVLKASLKFPEELLQLKNELQTYLSETKKTSESFNIPEKNTDYNLLITAHEVTLISTENNKVTETVEWKLNLNVVFKNGQKSDESSLKKLLFLLSNLDTFMPVPK